MAELVPGAARLVLQPGVRLLRLEERLFEAMTEGWRRQQLARHLAFGTIDARARTVYRFQAFTNADPAALRAPDLVHRNFTAERPDALWVADFTY